jgi:hypothetical protein
MSYFVVDYFRLNEWYKKKFFSLLSFFLLKTIQWQLFTKLIDTFFFYLVNIKKRKKKILEKLLTKSDSFDRIHTLLLNNSLKYIYIHFYILVGFKERWWWRWCYYQHSKSFNMLVMTTTRLCALFICLLRPCKTHLRMQEAVTAKKIIMITILFSPFPSSFNTQRDHYLIILNSYAFLNIKYQILPLEYFFFSYSRTSTITNDSISNNKTNV